MKSLVFGILAAFAIAGCTGGNEVKPSEGAVELTPEQKASLDNSNGAGEAINTPSETSVAPAADSPE